MNDDPEPRLRLERRAQAIVVEPDAVERAARVLEREVGMTGAADRDATDLALDPDVGEARIGPNRLADRPGDLADVQDLEAEGSGRRRRRLGRPGRRRPLGVKGGSSVRSTSILWYRRRVVRPIATCDPFGVVYLKSSGRGPVHRGDRPGSSCRCWPPRPWWRSSVARVARAGSATPRCRRGRARARLPRPGKDRPALRSRS